MQILGIAEASPDHEVQRQAATEVQDRHTRKDETQNPTLEIASDPRIADEAELAQNVSDLRDEKDENPTGASIGEILAM